MLNSVSYDRSRMSPFNPIPSFGHLWYILGYVHTTPNSYLCVVWIATVQNWNKSLTHIEQFGRGGFVNRVHTESWILEKVLKFAQQFPDLEKVPAFFKVSIDHLFGNLESRKRNYCYGKKSEKSLEFWIQKSVRTLCELTPSPHSVPYPICDAPLWEIGARQFRSVTEIAPKSPFLRVNRIPIRYGFCAGANKLSGKYEHLSDMWRSTLGIGAAQLRSVTEIAPESPFLCVKRIPIRYGFRAGAKAIQ